MGSQYDKACFITLSFYYLVYSYKRVKFTLMFMKHWFGFFQLGFFFRWLVGCFTVMNSQQADWRWSLLADT